MFPTCFSWNALVQHFSFHYKQEPKKKKILENNHNKKTKFHLLVDSFMSGMGKLLTVL